MTIKCDKSRCTKHAIANISLDNTSGQKSVLSRSLTTGVPRSKNKTQVNYCVNHYPSTIIARIVNDSNLVLSKINGKSKLIQENKQDFNKQILSKQRDILTLIRLDKILSNTDSSQNPMETFSNHEISLYVDNNF